MERNTSARGRRDLTLYDAAYLELARRLSLPLASQDKSLRLAAKKCKVPLLGMRGDKMAAA
ncbi:MAG: hypothetical protein EPN36_10765 [Rhodanobacteraceae bacterium]|nr:MAG: hypothetical protein EPN36_10765 [Rhodanobacteraceae bacterium]